MMPVQARACTFTEFISGNIILVIPVYQRNYDWRKANCEQLFNDIVGIIKNKKPHFIGTFVYQYNYSGIGAPQEYVIIDGQQRITSIILLAKALYDSTKNADLKNNIRTKFICSLRSNKFDRVIFEKLMTDGGFDESDFSEEEKNSPMYLNYRFFREKISASPLTHEEFCQAIAQLNVVYILLQEENPQEIFESLNSTGLDLTKADLIRNFLLMPLPYAKQEELYKNYWLKIEEKLRRPIDNVENFLEQYLVAKLKSRDAYAMKISPTTLYVVFKRYFANNFTDAESCLRDMLRCAKYFKRILFDSDTNFKKLSALDKKFYELTFLLKADNAPIILMYLLDRYNKNHFDEATFIKFVDALISLTVRSKICGNRGINQQFAGNVLARLDKETTLDTTAFWCAVTFGKERQAFPNDKDFQAALTTGKLYQVGKSGFCKYVLYSLERANPKYVKELPPYSEATIEHILPQNPDEWEEYLVAHNDTAAHKIWLNTLGNLTLTAYNSELGNKEFDIKKEIYALSSYPGTRALANYTEWTSAQIQLRAKKLAAVAVTIWKLPAEFNNILPDIAENFDLDSDYSALKGKKPETLYISDKKFKISTWIALLHAVAKYLYDYDEDTFRRAMQNVSKNSFTTKPTKFDIDDALYVQTGIASHACLRRAKILAEKFDALADTNFTEDIYFTIRQDAT